MTGNTQLASDRIAQEPSGRGRLVLVVDDDRIQRKLLRVRLEQLGFSILVAEDGVDGLDQARRRSPDVIISDVLMPRLDGFKFCVAVRQDPQLSHIPIVLTSSAFIEDADKRLAENAGCSAFVLRTPDLREVMQALFANLEQGYRAPASGPAELPLAEYADRVVNQLERQTALRAKILESLQDVIDTALTYLALDDLLRELLDRIAKALSSDTVAILLAEDDSLAAYAAKGLEEEIERGIRIPTGKGFAGRVAAQCAPVIVEDVTEADVVNPVLLEKGVRSLLGVPLLVDGQVTGVLHVGVLHPHRFREDEVLLLQLVADRVASAIERARLYEAERRARAEAEAALRVRDEFLAVAAHELKTPIAIMKGYAQLLRRRAEAFPPKERKLLAAIDMGADRMDRLVKDLLEVTQLQRRQLNFAMESIDLQALAQEAADAAAMTATRHEVRVLSSGPVFVMGDRGRLEQVLANLLTNAIKYWPDGGTVEVEVAARDGEAVVSVRDRGVGIPADRQGRIFEYFYRAHTGTKYDFGGMGVGLYISREMVSRNGGRMWFESREGEGSTFHFSLPLKSN